MEVAAPYHPRRGAKAKGSLAGGLLAAAAAVDVRARVKDLEHLREDVLATLSRLDAKRGRLQGLIAAASRGRRRAPRRAPAPGGAADAAAGARAPAPPLPADDDDHGACYYTRKGAGAVRKRLRAAAGGVKTEWARLEAELADLEEALVDARERLALQRGGRAA